MSSSVRQPRQREIVSAAATQDTQHLLQNESSSSSTARLPVSTKDTPSYGAAGAASDVAGPEVFV